MRKQIGFTVAELLITISIILLIGAILFPVMRSVKDAGTRTACSSNLRQLHSALTLYIEEYGKPPPPLPFYWVAAQREIMPILICPKDHTSGMYMMTGDPRGQHSSPLFVPHSYEFEFTIDRQGSGQPPGALELSDSSRAILVCMWHSFGEGEKSDQYQAVFGDGHIGKFEYPTVGNRTPPSP